MAVPFRHLAALLFLIIIPFSTAQAQDKADKAYTENFEAAAKSAKQEGLPLMLLFSADECSFCDQLHSEVLNHHGTNPIDNQLHLTEVNINRGGKLIDFDGDPIRGRIFVNRYEIIATPTVIIVAPDGKSLTKPVIGYKNKLSFMTALKQAIHKASEHPGNI